MNRRSFFGYLGKAAGVSLALPSILAAVQPGVNPAWVTTEYEIEFLVGDFGTHHFLKSPWVDVIWKAPPFPPGMGETVRGIA